MKTHAQGLWGAGKWSWVSTEQARVNGVKVHYTEDGCAFCYVRFTQGPINFPF
jgi:hypothetical protein